MKFHGADTFLRRDEMPYDLYDHIEKVDGECSAIHVVTSMTAKHEDLGNYEGEQCEVDHNHDKSKSCEPAFECDNCAEIHDNESDAVSCCAGWMCQHCGYTHHSGYYSSARTQAYECCLHSCEECGDQFHDFDSHDCDNGKGMRRQLPWEARGVVVDARQPDADKDWKSNWGFDPEKHNVVRAAADYYLLTALSWGIVGTTTPEGVSDNEVASHSLMTIIRAEAQAELDRLVKEWDEILIAYTHMAVGGELRHHNAVGGEVLSSDRDSAWNGWKLIFEAVGNSALSDAAELFEEFSGGSFGGKPWADACRILHARLTGKINPQMFLDRIFNHQHNGGNFLNKVRWAGDMAKFKAGVPLKDRMSLSDMTNHLLPAHGQEPTPDYATLLAYASTPVQSLFADSYEYAGHAAKELGSTALQTRAPRPKAGMTMQERRNADEVAYQAKLTAKYNQPKSAQIAEQIDSYKGLIKQYEVYAANEELDNEAKKALVASGNWHGCICEDCISGKYYSKQVKEYTAELDKLYVKYNQAKLDEMNPLPTPEWDWPTTSDEDDYDEDGDCPCCSSDYDPYEDNEGDFEF